MISKNWFKLLGPLALEYRLSLDNLCKILNIEVNDENRMMIYNEILSLNYVNRNEYKYLFNNETVLEKKEVSNIALSKAISFMKDYMSTRKLDDKTKFNEVKARLTKTDRDFQDSVKKLKENGLTLDVVEKIARYRLKHCISRVKICEFLNIRSHTFLDKEKLINDPILQLKLQNISEYYYNIPVDKRLK